MPLFKPKQSPVFTAGRVKHVLFGEHFVLIGAAIGGALGSSYQGLGWGIVAACAFAVGWELLTKQINALRRAFGAVEDWDHEFADVIDLVAYLIGAVVAVVVVLLI